MKIAPSENVGFLFSETTFIETLQCFQLQISEHNQIGIHVGKGIEILALDCSSTTTKIYRRELISTPNGAPLEKFLRFPNNSLLWSENMKNFTDMSQHTETVGLLMRYNTTTTVLDYKFSPAYYHACYLGIITSLGSLTVFQNIADEWTPVYDVTELWLTQCSQRWETAQNWPQWKAQLEEAKPVSLCWICENGRLYLIAALINGDTLVFEENGEDKFSLILKTQLAADLREPCDVHGFFFNGDLCVVVGAYSGEMTAIFIDIGQWQLRRSVRLWDVVDYAEPTLMTSVKLDSSLLLVTSKTHFIVVHDFAPDGSVSSRELGFDSSIVGVSLSGAFIYVTLHNMIVMQMSMPSLAVVSRWCAGTGRGQGGVFTSNGYVSAVAGASGDLKSRVTLLVKEGIDSGEELRTRQHAGFSQYFDLLWLHKVSLLKGNTEMARIGHDLSRPLLCHWELQLRLASGQCDDATRKMLRARLRELDRSFIEAYAANAPDTLALQERISKPVKLEDLCAVCGGGIAYSDMRVIRCLSGHNVARCCLSLKVCSALRYVACVLCGAKTSTTTTTLRGIQSKSCPFCRGFFSLTADLL